MSDECELPEGGPPDDCQVTSRDAVCWLPRDSLQSYAVIHAGSASSVPADRVPLN